MPPRSRGRTASLAVLLVVLPFAYVVWREWTTRPRPVDLAPPSVEGILPPASARPPSTRRTAP